jgi:hypothetical protein
MDVRSLVINSSEYIFCGNRQRLDVPERAANTVVKEIAVDLPASLQRKAL